MPNKPFLRSKNSYFQTKAKCKTFLGKLHEIHLDLNKKKSLRAMALHLASA